MTQPDPDAHPHADPVADPAPDARPASPATARGRRRAVFAGLALLLSLGLAAVVGEVALRILDLDVPARRYFSPGIYRADPDLGWALLPGYRGVHREYSYDARTSTNARGFRGPEWDAARRAAPVRVLCLGDSCTFGRGVNDGEEFTARLEVALRARLGREVSVYAAAVPGYDTVQEDVLHAQLQAELAPQVVVVAWLPNDVLERSVETRKQQQVIDGQLVRDAARYKAWKYKIEGRGLYRSALYRFLRLHLTRLTHEQGNSNYKGDLSDLAYSQEPLARIHERARAAGARLVVALFPRVEEISGAAGTGHHEAMRAWCAARGIAVVDFPARWRGRIGVWGPRYIEGDSVHFTAAGYEAIAQELAAEPVWAEVAPGGGG
ncbi:MAG: SGNH/GDSL hydrolase family protein [Planctomycetota bacterium]